MPAAVGGEGRRDQLLDRRSERAGQGASRRIACRARPSVSGIRARAAQGLLLAGAPGGAAAAGADAAAPQELRAGGAANARVRLSASCISILISTHGAEFSCTKPRPRRASSGSERSLAPAAPAEAQRE